MENHYYAVYISVILVCFNFQAAIWNRFPCPCSSKGLW